MISQSRNVDGISGLTTEEKRALLARLLRERTGRGDSPRRPWSASTTWLRVRRDGCPRALAVVADDGQLTYAELDAPADRVARRYGALGVGPDSRVGTCLNRGVHLVPALLGVLKAGAEFLPLDPTYPAERLKYMATDAELAALVTERSLRAPSPVAPRRNCCLRTSGRRERTGRLGAAEPAAENLAYVIYTSGL